MENNKGLVFGDELNTEMKRRTTEYEILNVEKSQVNQFISNGWSVATKLKNTVRLKKEKILSYDETFENAVWLLFYKMGFTSMNQGRFFKLPYSINDDSLTQQIDVFAADEESIVIIECKASKNIDKKTSFKTEIEAIGGKRQGLIVAAKKMFPNKKLKVKVVFATKNYALGDQDRQRLQDFNIAHFDEDTIKYYYELNHHLGYASRYQLLGNLFEGQKIPEMNRVIPAIEGKMGNHIYYSFSIEPEKLLKMGFVLHHDNAYKDEMPAYQRIIKKSRLKAVKQFIDKGGYFPNSVIISITTKSKLQFDKAGLQDDKSISKIGLLHLPQEYKSIYIIDGQHRLYGYSDSEWKSKNTIPVVAFVNLDRNEQIKLFMDINENQKAVPKNLRTTLEADLLWDSEDYNEQRRALSSHIAQRLGNDKKSALYGRIISGENTGNSLCAITLDYIVKSLKQSNFYNKYNKKDVIQNGSFDKGNNDATVKKLYPFLIKSFDYLEKCFGDDWGYDTNNDSALVANTFIYGYIRVFSDIVDCLVNKKVINPMTCDTESLIDECLPYYDIMINYVQALDSVARRAFRKEYGRVGDNRFWRSLQQSINQRFCDFAPEGLSEFWRDNSMKYNEEAFKIIRDIELYLKESVFDKLKTKYGPNWFRNGCPKSVYDNAQKLASDKNFEKKDDSPDALPEDQLHLIDYREIALYASNWSELFEKMLADPNVSGDKKKRTEWLQKLNTIRNQNFHTYSISEEEFQFISSLKNWLIKK